jgi:outer membrane protein TolC
MIEGLPPRLRGGMPMVRVIGTQMLPWFGKRDRMAAVAEREADAVAARADLTILDVVTAGRRAYYDLLLNQEARTINREQRAIVDTVVQVATGRLSSGAGMHHDVLKMQTEATMLDDALVMLEADRREMAAMVNALLDRPAETPVGEPEDAWSPGTVLDRGRLVKAAIAHRPELREMVSMEAAERAMAEAARREYYPDLMLGALYDFKTAEPNTVGGMLGLNIPIWIGSKQRLDVRAAETRARAVERERAAMAAMVRAEIERQLARVDAADRRVRLLDTEFIPRAQQTFDSAIRAFPSGTVDVLSLLDSLRTLEAQKLNRTAVRVERETALVDLERAVGVPLKEIAR